MNRVIWIVVMCWGLLSYADGDYQKHVTTLQGYMAQINSIEGDIRNLIKEKNETQSAERLKEIIETIKSQLANRKNVIERYLKEYHHIRYEHPEKGKTIEAKYKRINSQYEKKFEDEVNSLLSEVYLKVKEQYPEEGSRGN